MHSYTYNVEDDRIGNPTCPAKLIDELNARYEAYKVLYDINHGSFSMLWERFSSAAFCDENRKAVISMYLELESFVDTINEYKVRYCNFDFSYYIGINRFLKNYHNAVYHCLNLE